MVQAMVELGSTEGIFACPEGAATLVGLKHLLQKNYFDTTDTIILMNTGSGLKYLDLVGGMS